MTDFVQKISDELQTLGVRPGGVLLVHSSLKSLGWVPGGTKTVIQALLSALGKDGTLLMPALSYETVRLSNPYFNICSTPSCVGIIPEVFRQQAGTRRSLHPTHSACATGPLAEQLLTPHQEDSTPCGPNSPFRRLPDFDGQILMLGCGLHPNTSMHAIEEQVEPSYLFAPPITYILIHESGKITQKEYRRHNFLGWQQRYDRVAEILTESELQKGKVLKAQSHLIQAKALWSAALSELRCNPLFFVDQSID